MRRLAPIGELGPQKRHVVFDWLIFEVAGMSEETLVNHHHTEDKPIEDLPLLLVKAVTVSLKLFIDNVKMLGLC